ncbi:MAG: TrmB family transcriptional regulator [Candidatus Jordarchaeum sp.]|uniref:TrmB family transcriptional regulator n=1 Tax=Candidatus Jordarchaeum sp. TaxID=2823881 RepID=UPI00404B479F
MISDKTKKALEDIGLTKYEIEAYLTLLTAGSLTAIELSKKSGVPYSRIYEVAERLEKKGWVKSDRGRPNRYQPKPPIEGMRSIKLQIQKEIENNEEQIISELQPLYERSGESERPDIWIIHGEENLLEKIGEMVEKPKKSILIAFPKITEENLDVLQQILDKLRGKDIETKFMTSNVEEKILDKLFKYSRDIRTRDIMYGGGIIIDNHEAIIIFPEISPEGDVTFSMGIWSDHLGLAALAADYFEYLWSTSKLIKK